MTNSVYIATSLDGYIADRNNQVEWLHMIPNPDGLDFGYAAHMDRVDALVMGRNTFDLVRGFDCDWPYTKPVFVLSRTLTELPSDFAGNVELINGPLTDVVDRLHQKGHQHLYIDGGVTIQSFLKEDLIDEMIITLVPIVLGGGFPLFGELANPLVFEHTKAEIFLDALVQNHYCRKRSAS